MSKKRRNFTAEFKAKVVLELIEGEQTLNEIASKYDILPKSLQQWKKQFLSNASLAFDKSAVVQEYKEQIEDLTKQKDELAKTLGEVTIERNWAVKKLKSLDLSTKRAIIDNNEGVQADSENPSLNKQLQLIGMSKTAHYYRPVVPFGTREDQRLLNAIDAIHTDFPYYGTRRVMKELGRQGFKVGRKLIKRAFAFMGIRALYPQPKTTVANKEHHKYGYLLNEFKNNKGQVIVDEANLVWSADITYVRLQKGFAYLAAIIDWHTKKILSWKLSNTMDVSLTTDVLKDALSRYPKPKIFNTDQGSQYTAQEHIQILTDHKIAISMDAKGRSIDNIVVERFWRSIKYEDIYPSSYQTIKEARRGIGEYIDTYNTRRLHSAIGYKTPNEVYYASLNNEGYRPEELLLKQA
ncbi:MAG: IS3 family transposase [Sulfurovum sp.]|nr:IS3 family transposase [Sulfurovum sp.]